MLCVCETGTVIAMDITNINEPVTPMDTREGGEDFGSDATTQCTFVLIFVSFISREQLLKYGGVMAIQSVRSKTSRKKRRMWTVTRATRWTRWTRVQRVQRVSFRDDEDQSVELF